MAAVRQFVRQYFYTILLLTVAGGFVMLIGELILDDHVDGTQLVGMIAAVVGAILGVAALFLSSRQARDILAIAFVVLSVSGVIGVAEHADARSEEGGEAALSSPAATDGYQPVALRAQEQNERGGRRSVPPPLAPLSLSGLAFLGAVVLLATPEPRPTAAPARAPQARGAAPVTPATPATRKTPKSKR